MQLFLQHFPLRKEHLLSGDSYLLWSAAPQYKPGHTTSWPAVIGALSSGWERWPFLLFSSDKTHLGYCVQLWASLYKHMDLLERSPCKGHEDDESTRVYILWGEAEWPWTVQLEKAQAEYYKCVSKPVGSMQRRWNQVVPVVPSSYEHKPKDTKFYWNTRKKKIYCQIVRQVAERICVVSIVWEIKSPAGYSPGQPAYDWVQGWTTWYSEDPSCDFMDMNVRWYHPNVRVRKESKSCNIFSECGVQSDSFFGTESLRDISKFAI